ncbi:hypothetical protein [Polaribacter glomeratus]|uniref:Uncharacterized protein n=1 Tax=Polaribacter glomeratus TaxID=102 RepID=A0A2S7WFW4_9FLAO|nr:hypothetical protein [Polaribacter glomeratus]PQJ76509.1 hypothetical protein BTO16_11430 [Polaribacter glomeratus]TXD64193.1 hypothetical protein ESX12_15895 [Polaribacter glomeratus]
MEQLNAVDVLIENISSDQLLLPVVEAKIEEAKAEKQVLVNRLKEYRKDLSVLLKYATEAQQGKIKNLGFEISDEQRGLNTVATTAFDVLVKAKDHQLNNQVWYDGYVASLKNGESPVSYASFNVKCRSLFNTQKVLRKKAGDLKSSHEDIISLNGHVTAPKKK